VERLLGRNHKEHDIFFRNGLHNHFPHTLLSLYALGADDKRLEEEWTIESYLDKIGERQGIQVTEENWKNFIGQSRFYSSYLDFFDEEVKKHGPLPAAVKYAFDEALFASLIGGAAHPLIHLGFGVEFSSALVVSEALAQASVHERKMIPLLQFTKEKYEPTKQITKLLDVIQAIRDDRSLDNVVSFSVNNKTDKTITDGADKLNYYASQFVIEDKPESIERALEQLYTTSMYIYGAACFHPKAFTNKDFKHEEIKLDFFIMHVLTSVLAVRVLLPHLELSQAKQLLQGHLAVTLMYYVARGRPPINTSALDNYEYSQEIPNWSHIFELATQSTDLHVPKVIRALYFGNQLYGQDEKDTTSHWFKVAALTVDWLQNRKNNWDFTAAGFIEAWK